MAFYSLYGGVYRNLILIEGKTLHECGVCKEVFIRRQDLIEHMVTHTKKLPFVSTSNNKAFYSASFIPVYCKLGKYWQCFYDVDFSWCI